MVSISGGLSGALTGGSLGGLWGGIGGGLAGLFLGGNEKDLKLEDLRTPEQLEAARILMQLGTTGSGAGITLGTPYGGSLGSFSPTQLEQSGLSQLFGGGMGTNTALQGAESTFSRLANAAFDPSVLEPFRKAAYREQGEANDILNREGAISGNRFGTAILGEKRELAENTQNMLQQKLAELFLNQQNVSLAGAQGLAGVGGQQANLAQQNLSNLFNYGALERQLKNQEAQAQYNEFTRQRSEELGRIDLLGQEANRNPYLGVSSLPGEATPFQSLINTVLGGIGSGVGESIGTSGFDNLKKLLQFGTQK